MSRFAFWLAGRLSLRTPGDKGMAAGRRRSPGAVIAVAGVAVSIAVMMLSVAIVTGFKQRIADKVTGFNSQISLTADRTDRIANTGGVLMEVNAEMRDALGRALPPHAQVTPDIALAGILKTQDDFEGIIVRGPADGAPRRFIAESIVRGRMPSNERHVDNNEIALSAATAARLQLDTASRVDAHFFTGGRMASRRFTVTGIYDTGFGDYDRMYAFVPNRVAGRLAGVDDDGAFTATGDVADGDVWCTTLDINGLDADSIDYYTDRLNSSLTEMVLESPHRDRLPMMRLNNVHTLGAQYFSWLELLDTNVVVILTLMALVAAFTLVSSLFILILERVSLIGTLKSLGATDGVIRRTFIYLTLRLVLAGMAIGNAVALTVIIVQERWHLLPLDPAAYYLDHVPMQLSWSAWLLLNAGAVAVAVLTLVLPSQLVARLRPADTMRFD